MNQTTYYTSRKPKHHPKNWACAPPPSPSLNQNRPLPRVVARVRAPPPRCRRRGLRVVPGLAHLHEHMAFGQRNESGALKRNSWNSELI